jgi:hypothetical protein
VSESGIVSRLMTATRHSDRNAARITRTSRKPSSRAWARLWIETSMKSDCRKTVISKCTSGRPGRSEAIASSIPLVICRVLPRGSFSTTSSSPWPSPMIASPTSGWLVSLIWARLPSGTLVPSVFCTVTLARSDGVTMGSTLRIPSCWFAVST